MRRYPLILLIVLGASAGSAQQPTQPSQPQDAQPGAVTFRAETNFVEVHAIVTDRTTTPSEELVDAVVTTPAPCSSMATPVSPAGSPVRLWTGWTAGLKACVCAWAGSVPLTVDQTTRRWLPAAAIDGRDVSCLRQTRLRLPPSVACRRTKLWP